MSEVLREAVHEAEGHGGFPLSPQQRRLWALHRADPAAPLYAQCAVLVEEDLDVARLRAALADVVARYEVLRTCFRCPPGMKEPLQVIGEAELSWEQVAYAGSEVADREPWSELLWRAAAGAPLDLEGGPVLSALLATFDLRRHLLVLRLPALCADGPSMVQLVAEVARAYEAGTDLAAEEPLQYADLAAWQNELLDAADGEEGRAYWRRLELGSSLAFTLPFGRGTGRRGAFTPRAVALPLPPDLPAALARRAEELALPLSSLLLAGWLALLRRLTAGGEVAVGVAFEGRSYEGLAEVLGPLARYLPVAVAGGLDLPFARLAAELQRRTAEISDRQEFFSWSDLPGADAAAGYVASFDFVELPARRQAAGVGFALERQSACAERAALRLSWTRREDALAAELWYDESAVDRIDALRTAGQLAVLLAGAAAAPETPLARLPIVSPAERRRLVAELNDTARPLPEVPIHRLFEAWVERTPEAPALVFEGERLTFTELDARANRLARHLRALGVGPEVAVALLLPRSHELVVALIAVLKAGGCYVPVDPGLPAERTALLLAETAAPVVVCDTDPPPGLVGSGTRLVRLGADAELLEWQSAARPAFEVPPESAAYVLFTSGSTGRPKGVVIEHRQLASYVAAITERLDLPPGASYATVSTFAADLGNTAVFPALTTGGCLHVIAQERLADPEAMAQYFERHAIDCLKIVPSHLEALHSSTRPERVMPRRRLVVGGEPPRREWLDRVQALAPGCRILNHYGPTETTVGVLTHAVEPGGEAAVPLGRPLANARVYALDARLEPVPTWLAGEIAIGGASVARGYLGRPDLTAERFLPDPWSERPGARLYRTGDLARRRPDGLLDFLGRADDQVKIRGFRVEPGEIETVLREHPAVRAATVVAREDRPGQRRLVGYVAAVAGEEVEAAELTAFLAARLPDFMVPAALVVLPKLPLNANGKVDRQRLPAPESADVAAGFVAPRTEVERTLAEIWAAVLGVERVGVGDSFFRLGGDSIRSISVRGKALERGLDFSVAELFENPTVAQLAGLLAAREGAPPAAPRRTAPFSLLVERDRARLPEGIEDAYPLTRLQAGMVFHSEYSRGSAIYHDVHSYHLRLRLDLPSFAWAAAELAARHPALRTSFDLSGYSETLQLVHRRVTVPLTTVDLRGLSAERQEQEIAAWLAHERRRAFDWTRPPLVQLFVHRRADDALQFTLSFHHAVVDGWSTASLTAELFTRYLELLAGVERPAVPPLEVTFRDFVALERQALDSAEQRDFWRHHLAGRSTARLPRWTAARDGGEGEARTAPVAIPATVGEGLKRLAEEAGVPVKSAFLAAHMKALAGLVGERDVTTGLISNGRPEETDGERVLGLFLNTVPFRLELVPGRWLDLVQATFRAEQELTPYRRFPLAELQRVEGGEPLFETAFNYVHYHVYQGLIGAPEIQVLGQTGYEETNFALEANFALGLTDGSVLFWLSYRTPELSRAQVEQIGDRYLAVLRAMAAAPYATHAAFSPLSPPERHQLLVEWNDTDHGWLRAATAVDLLAQQAARTPTAIAMVGADGEWLTYGELMARVEDAAAGLAALGVGPGVIVALLAERSVGLWLAALAVLAAGGAYLPLDPRHPAMRQVRVAALSRAPLAVVAADLAPGFDAALSGASVPLRRLSLEELLAGGGSAVAPVRHAAPGDLAYVIYTSGSTGEPKGAMVEHRGMLNHLLAKVETLDLTARDAVAQTASQCFDISVWQVLAPLLVGGMVHVLADEVAHEPRALLAAVVSRGITVVETVPSLLRLVVDELPASGTAELGALRWLIPTGEALPPGLCRRWFAASPGVPLLNAYGPTECSDDVSHHRLSGAPVAGAASVPIGRPIPNLRLYLVDRDLLPVPLAVAAELCVGGVGVGRGYLGDPARTAEVFVPDPFAAEPGARLYRTGDLARWSVTGELDFLGRLDHQVKIRGHRIELGEIEAALASHPGVREAVVVARDEARSGGKVLAAYAVGVPELAPAAGELRAFLKERLPEAMIPTSFVLLEALPLTANGKLDRRALPAPGDDDLEGGERWYVPPRTPDEELLAGVWSEVLGRERVAADDDFFALGGDSLTATQVVSRLRRLLGLELPLRDLFEAPTLTALALRLAALRRAAAGLALPPLAAMPRTGPIPLSFAQERLWFIEQLAPGSAAYHIHRTLALHGPLDAMALERCLAEILRRHEALRTRFVALEGVPAQVIVPADGWRLPRVDLSSLAPPARQGEARRIAATEAARPFDLARDVLLRVVLLALAPAEHAAALTLHHIAADGWSVGVLVGEVAALYAAFAAGRPSSLPELPVQYADYAQWQRQWLQGETLASQMRFWRAQLGDGEAASELPGDRPRPAVPSSRSAAQRFGLPAADAEAVRAFARREGATLFMVLLAALETVVHRYTGRDDVVVGSPIANRNVAEVEGLIGFFVNTLALRLRLDGTMSFRDLVARARSQALAAYAHQDLPFEKLVEELAPQRDPSRNPLVQVMLVLQNAPLPPLQLTGLTLHAWEIEHRNTRFDLEVMLWEGADGIQGPLIYARDLFDASTIVRLGVHLGNLLADGAAHPDRSLAQLAMLSPAERWQLVGELNDTLAATPHLLAHELFEAAVRRAPDAPAVLGDEPLTYTELNHRANRLAHVLRRQGVGPEVRVGLLLRRSPELLAAVLAVLKAGGTYVPLDPTAPAERLALLAREAELALVLRGTGVAWTPPAGVGAVMSLDSGEVFAAASAENPERAACPDNLAYVLFTSGSTGRPKGVMVSHGGLANYLAWCARAYPLDQGIGAPVHSPIGFDLTVTGLFAPLLAGRAVALLPEERGVGALAAALVGRGGWSFVKLTPAHLDALRAELPGTAPLAGCAAALIVGGEALLGEQLAPWRERAPATRLINEYGPTEAVVGCAVEEVAAGEPPPVGAVPIGRPIINAALHLLDAAFLPVPMGAPGELYIGGRGLARGYLGNARATAARFVPDPYGTDPGGRLYATGDLARRLSDGRLVFLGRADHQVKIRGFRVEPGEIEATLLTHPIVREAAVIDRDGPGGRRLAAYVILAEEAADREAEGSGLGDEQVSEWRSLYDEVYAEPGEARDPDFDIRGWNSSFTGEPIPADEMREWVERTVERILALRPRRVLEIGCGSGLLLRRVAPHVERYLGTDLSPAAVRLLEAEVAGELPQVELFCRPAPDFSGMAEGEFDLVVLNSVVQYFPSGTYLLRVLEGAVRAVRDGGFVFVGDVRNLALLEAFHAAVELQQAPASLPVAQWRERVRRRAAEDRELVVDPAFWSALAERLPRIDEAVVQLKRGHADNELTRFRYDVVLSVGEPASRPQGEPWRLDWSTEGMDLDGLRRRLATERPQAALVTGVPNRRVAGDLAGLRRAAEGSAPATVGELAASAPQQRAATVEPEELWSLAAELGYTAEIGWSADPGALDVVFRRPALAAWSVRAPLAPASAAADALQLVNRPLQPRLARRLLSELRAFLADRLPDYMVPSAFAVLDTLPLTPHGKLDRRALPAPEQGRDLAEAGFEPPVTPTEQILAGLWSQVLGVGRVGARDDFFRLGGHSLLATQMLARLRAVLGVEVPLRALFQSPTLAEFAAVADQALQAGAPAQAPPIEPVPRRPPLPLSFAQGRLWFLDQLDPGQATYNLHTAFHLRGPLDTQALARSFTAMVARHEVLRTTFRAVGGVPEQVIAPPAPVPLPWIDVRDLPAALREAEARRLSAVAARRPFDLERGPLLRLRLVQVAAAHHLVLATLHHIAGDGWSMGIVLREMAASYRAFAAGERPAMPELPVQYADFAVWQRRWLDGPVLAAELDFWRRRLAGAPPVLELPADRPRPPVQRFRGRRLTLELGPALTRGLRELSLAQGVTPFMTLLAAFAALLCRLTGRRDLLIGTPIAGRSRREVEGLIGLFVNTLVLRTKLSGDPTFPELLAQVREVSLAAHAHQDLPFERLVEELQPERDLSHSPLVQVLFVMQNVLPTIAAASDLYVEPLETDGGAAKFDLTLDLLETSADVLVRADYDVDLFDASTIGRLLGQYRELLAAVTADPRRRLGELPLLTARERQQLLVEWGLRPFEADHGICLHELFAAQAARTPEAIALAYEDRWLTYGELDRTSSRLARRLRALGVGPDVRVGLCVERSPEMIWSILGILKAGGAYVPLDPEYPAERLAFLIQDTAPPVLLTQQRLAPLLPASSARVLCVDEGWTAEPDGDADAAASAPTPDHLAYIIHTSGSTGLPKGSLIAHRGVANQLLWRQRRFPLGPEDRVLQTDSFSFDPSAWQIFWPLLAGARLVLVRPGGNRESGSLVQRMAEHGITVVGFVPSMLAMILEELELPSCRSLRHLFCGGEALRPELVARFFDRLPGAELHNVYGPTEASIDATDATYRCPQDLGGARIAPIGRPIGNKAVYVLDQELRPVPIGVPGELYVGGVGLARGYLGRPELTAERFVPDSLTAGQPGARLYRTGDLVRHLRDGAIEFLGRIDHQVKVRGFRIELGEVEAVLNGHPAVRESTVVVREDQPEVKRLVAYYVAVPGAAAGVGELRAHLHEKLPGHMVPAAFVRLDALPLSPNGKVDRRALPAPDGERPDVAVFVAPRTPAEQVLAAIWERVLGIERVGVHDNFFDLGGDSILSIQIVARARQAGLQLTARDAFQHQTVAELAAAAGSGVAVDAEQGPVTGPAPLTPIQRWFLERDLADAHHFNQAVLLTIRESLSPALLAGALAALLAHHDALRLRLASGPHGVEQKIAPPEGAAPLTCIELSALPAARRSATLEAAVQALHAGLDLERGPLTRLALFDLGPGDARLFWVAHHLAVDGVSWRILLDDLATAYGQLARGEAVALPPKTTSFKRWGERLAEHAASEELRREAGFWLAQRPAGDPALPLDDLEGAEGREGDRAGTAETVVVGLDPEETSALLTGVPRAYRTEINDALLAAVAQAFAGWTGKRALLVDLEGHGREDLFADVDLSRTVGWFTAIYPVLLDIEGCDGPGEVLAAVKERLRHVPRHGVGYGLLRYLCPDPEIAAALAALPRAEVSFNYLGQLDRALHDASPFAGAPESTGSPESPRARRAHLLEIGASVAGRRLWVGIRYGRRVHRRATVERLAAGVCDALRALIAGCRGDGTGGPTPSDFPLAELDAAALDRLAVQLAVIDGDDEEEPWA